MKRQKKKQEIKIQSKIKNVIVYYFPKKIPAKVTDLIKYQIKIALALGWPPENIVVLSNAKIETDGVTSVQWDPPTYAFSHYIYKELGMIEVLKNLKDDEIMWCHDWDLIPIDRIYFTFPPGKDFSMLYGPYAQKRGKPNSGSIFAKSSALEILEEVATFHEKVKRCEDESSFGEILKEKMERVHDLNTTYNMGTTNFVSRISEAEKPLKCFHIKWTNPNKVNRIMPYAIKQAKTNKSTKKVVTLLTEFFDKYDILSRIEGLPIKKGNK